MKKTREQILDEARKRFNPNSNVSFEPRHLNENWAESICIGDQNGSSRLAVDCINSLTPGNAIDIVQMIKNNQVYKASQKIIEEKITIHKSFAYLIINSISFHLKNNNQELREAIEQKVIEEETQRQQLEFEREKINDRKNKKDLISFFMILMVIITIAISIMAINSVQAKYEAKTAIETFEKMQDYRYDFVIPR